jgi:CRISPR-associated endonuclease Csn1
VVGDKQVRCVKGGTTAELRWQWGLEGLWPNAAERDGDHRRHAVDAMVVGLTTRAALQSLSAVKYNPAKPGFEAPWRHFRHEVEETWSAVNVSFRPTRRLGGALHEDTGLGSVEGKASRYVHRVPVASLTVAMVRQIRDPVIRSIVEVRCREKGVDLEGRGKVGKVLCDPPLRMASGVVIRRVRIETTEKTAIPIRNVGGKVAKAVLPGGNHHVEIYESINKIGETVWTGRCVSRFEAHQRLHHGRPVVDQNPADGVKFVMSLCINDMVLMTDSQTGEVGLFRVQKMSSGVPFLELRWHTAATIQDKATRYLIATWDKLRSCAARKVLVDPIGRLLPCHD